MTLGWYTFEPGNGDDNLQVVPGGDLIEHDMVGFDCICGPTIDFTQDVPLVIHHALDGRK